MGRVVFSFFLLIVAANVYGQSPEEYVQQQAQVRRMRLMQVLDSGVVYMDNGQFEKANERFTYVLTNIKGVPSDLAFYFGKNSYFMQEYSQSIDWLNKYIQLKGTKGQHSEEAVAILRKAEVEVIKAQMKEHEKSKQVLSSDYEIDCGPSGKVICPVCHGEHVIIKKAAFGFDYRTCPYCDEHGILTCAEYNLLVKGELEPKF